MFSQGTKTLSKTTRYPAGSMKTTRLSVERTARGRRVHFIRGTPEKLAARRVGRHDANESEILGLDGQSAIIGDEVVMRERRRGGYDLGATDDQPAIGLLFHVHIDIAHFLQFLVAIHRRVDDCVVDEADLFLHFLVPPAGVLLERLIELGIGA